MKKLFLFIFLISIHAHSELQKYDTELDKVLNLREEVGVDEFEAHKSYYTKDLNEAYLQMYLQSGIHRPPHEYPTDIKPSVGENGSLNGGGFPKGVWVFTFDDGPHPKYTKEIMELFDQKKFPMTFFWLAENIERYKDLALSAAGFSLFGESLFSRGLHSYTHPHFSSLNASELYKEVVQAKEVFKNEIGSEPTLFRCPYGDCGVEARKLIAAENMVHVMWNVDSLDWADHDPQSIFLRVQKQMVLEGQGIILFHDIHPQSVLAAQYTLDYIQKNGLKVESLPKVISEIRGSPFDSP